MMVALQIVSNTLAIENDLESSYCISIGTCYSKEGKLITDLYFECINELDTLISVSTIYKGNDLDFISKISKVGNQSSLWLIVQGRINMRLVLVLLSR